MISDFLKKYRAENGLTQAELATKLSISQNAVSQYENEKRKPPVSSLSGFAKALGVAVSDIMQQ